MTFWIVWLLTLMDFLCCTIFNIVWIKASQIIANHLEPPLMSNFSILTESFIHFGINIYGFCLFNHYVKVCSLQLIFIRKIPRVRTRPFLKEGFIIGPWLCPLISNFDPCSIYPPCVKGPWRTFSLMRTVLRGDTKSYKITTSKPLLSKLRFVIPQAVKMPRITF